MKEKFACQSVTYQLLYGMLDFHKIRYSFYKKSSKKSEFSENQLSDKHNLLKGVNEFMSVLSAYVD